MRCCEVRGGKVRRSKMRGTPKLWAAATTTTVETATTATTVETAATATTVETAATAAVASR